MNAEFLTLMREWIRAEIDARIADTTEGPDGYFGTGYAENREADRLFAVVIEKSQQGSKQ